MSESDAVRAPSTFILDWAGEGCGGKVFKAWADFLEGVEAVEGSEGRAKKEAKDSEISLRGFRLHRVEYGRPRADGVKQTHKSWEKSRQMDRIGLFFFFFFLDFFKVPRPNSDSKTPNSPSGLGTKLVNLEVLQVLI